LLSLVKAFNQEDPAHAIHPVYQGDYFELLAKLRTALHAGSAPAVTHVVAEVLPYFVAANVLEPLDTMPGLDGDLGFVRELSQAGAFQRGDEQRMYGIPFNRSTPIAYCNGNLLDELGLAPPRTWDELVTFSRAASLPGDSARFGFSCPIDWWFWVALVFQAGGELTDGEGRFTLGGEAGVEALALWQRLVLTDKTMRTPTGRDYNAWGITNREFLAGRAAMIWNSTAFVRYLEENAKFPVVAAPLPSGVRAGVPTGGTLFVMPKGSPPAWQEAGARFLAFMSRPAVSNEFATRTGYIAVTRQGIADLEAAGYYERFKNDRVAVDQLKSARAWPWHTELFRVQREAVQGRLEAAVLSGEDPRAVVKAALIAIERSR
jgi:sn-glycerol 3-phosphate transport system substrate-binding protein